MTFGRNILGWAILYTVVIVLVALSRCGCQTPDTGVVYRFVNPALRGMVSNYDIGVPGLTEALYLLNGRVTETMGRLKRRPGLADYGANTTKLYGAYGYYNSLSGHKLAIGVTDHATYNLGQVVVSDTFGTEVGYDTLEGTIFPYADAYHDWTPYEYGLVHADGKSTPFIFTTSQLFYFIDTTIDTLVYDTIISISDTNGYHPHLTSMGLEAPGQLRATVLDDTGSLNGTYQYALAYFLPECSSAGSWGWNTDSLGEKGLPSAPVYPRDERVIVTLFSVYPPVKSCYDPRECTTADSNTRAVLLRSKRDGNPTWFIVDTLYYGRDSEMIYIDSISDTVSTLYYKTSSMASRPGAFAREWIREEPYGAFCSLQAAYTLIVEDTTGETHLAYWDSAYTLAYSHYDKVTGIESPLGPTITMNIDTLIGISVIGFHYVYGLVKTDERPPWIRVYQGIKNASYPGGGDTMVWYGLFEIRGNEAFGDSNLIKWGQWSDADVVAGLDTANITMDTIYSTQLLRNSQGDVKTLPPYNFDCQIPFSDIEYFDGHFWGIGDPDYPSRVYWSQFDWPTMNIFSWPPTWFTQIRELGNDELIAIERAEGYGDDALYLFAHNSIWLMNKVGHYQIILPPSGHPVGAASRETIVKHGAVVYFISPNLRIYALSGTQLAEISKPIENYVESVFVNYDRLSNYRGFYAWGHTLGDYVRWFNDSTGLGLSFNTKPESGVWSLEQYGSGLYSPRGSFVYDTLHSGGLSIAPTYDLELLYTDSAVSLRKEDVTAASDVAGTRLEKAIQFAYETPNLGDHDYNQQITEVDLTLEIYDPGALHYTVYDEDRNSLCGDSVSLVYSDTIVRLRVSVPYNNSFLPSLRVYTNDTDSLYFGGGDPYWAFYYHNFDIIDMSVRVVPMGVGYVK